MSELTCRIDFNVDDKLSPIRAFLNRMQGVLDADTTRCHVDLTKCQYLGPDAIALLATTVLEKQSRGFAIRVSMPEGPSALRAYCRFSGLEAVVNSQPVPEAEDQPVVPLRRFTSASWTGLCNLSAMIEDLGGEFVIISETSGVRGVGTAGQRSFFNIDHRFPGTAVFFMVPVKGL